jgi:hypothetical protein
MLFLQKANYLNQRNPALQSTAVHSQCENLGETKTRPAETHRLAHPQIQNSLCSPWYIHLHINIRQDIDIENNTWAHGDVRFIFECSSLISHKWDWAWTQEDKFISPSVHVSFCLLYKHFTQIQKKKHGNRWLTKTRYQHNHVKNIIKIFNTGLCL